MNKIFFIVIVLSFTLLNINSDAFAVEHDSNIIIETPYVRASIPGTTITSAYMSIENKNNAAIILTGASGLFSDRIEIHQHTMSDGMMKMRQVEQLIIEGDNKVILQPMGYHLMIFNVKKALLPEEEVSLTLHFKQQKDLVVTIAVRSIKQKNPDKKQHHHH
ncbi:copper chaperone PCu(A)C [Colwellia hornerae]|uniref:Copper chaperone PCu(A)C n=1 Tax=Colwellia hornerae TaxID=89402 RepID=A0A5C6QFZ6_9GAMM|nr:copper chaperone PCu(A)C [Colwellia hornerae]TWX55242.1 copper chaperone PCu(A)C [Colwellia hornerae]TWX61242.1 copper chaperone PCu(A)C [Colwellia hornerae]TWX67711.1 copper chaperone PCu(A)C [Colwellia hornerae]